MPRIELPSPTLRLSRAEARRFLLAHQHLWPPRALAGKAGILDFIRHVGCIQYDPVNLVGQNPELVLQARVADYTPALLAELLYTDRRLVDGWDKQAAIYLTEDWPYFARHRDWARRDHGDPSNPPMAIADGGQGRDPRTWPALFRRPGAQRHDRLVVGRADAAGPGGAGDPLRHGRGGRPSPGRTRGATST